jgi:tetratricopeptide (TPR) repeat protein
MKASSNINDKASLKTALQKDKPGEVATPGKAETSGYDMEELRNILLELKQHEYALFNLAKSYVDQAAKQDLSRRLIATDLLEKDKGAEANELLAHEELDRRLDVLNRREARTGKDVSKARQELLDEYLLKTKTAMADHRLRVREQRKQAAEAFVKAIELQRLLESPLEELAGTLFDYGHLLYDMGEHAEAKPYYNEALDLYRRLALDDPEKYRPEAAKTLSYMGAMYYMFNDLTQVELVFTEALRIRRDLSNADPLKHRKDLAYALNDMASLQSKLGNSSVAEELHSEALEIYRKLSQRNPDSYCIEKAMTLYNIGCLHQYAARYQYAQSEYLEAIAHLRKLVVVLPELRENLSFTLCNLGMVHDHLKQINLAEAAFNEAIAIRREQSEVNLALRPELAKTIACLANMYDHHDLRPKAEVQYLEVLTIWRDEALRNPEYRMRVAQTLTCLGYIQGNIDKMVEAEKNLNESVTMLRELYKKDQMASIHELAWAVNRRGLLYCDLKRYKEARVDLEECIAFHRRIKVEAPQKNSTLEMCAALCAYGVMLVSMKKSRKGKLALKEARAIAASDMDHPLTQGFLDHIDGVINAKK